jgi:Xaa-Pro dipeptidase
MTTFSEDPSTYRETAFSPEEFDGRLTRVRERMRDQGLDVLVVSRPENVYYLSGFHTMGYWDPIALIVPSNGEPVHLQFAFESYNVERMSRWTNVIGYNADQDPMLVLAATLEDISTSGDQIGFEKLAWFTTEFHWDILRSACARSLVDGSGIVDSSRMIKTDAEIAYLRRAGAIASRAMLEGLTRAAEGVSEREVALAVYSTAIAEGSEYPAIPAIISSGERASMPHATWSDRVMGDGDNLLMEIGASVARYHAACFRNKVIGRPSREQEEASATVFDAMRAAAARMIPGTAFHDVDAACRAVMRKAGLEKYWLTMTAYPIGIGFPPNWGEYPQNPLVQPGEETLIEVGMVLHVIPTSNRHARPGGGHIGASDTVLITANGAEYLTDTPQRLFSSRDDG